MSDVNNGATEAPQIDQQSTVEPAQDDVDWKDDQQSTIETAQDDVDWKAEARKWEKRAKANAAAAKRLAEIESEAGKVAERLAKAELAAAEAEARALRREIALEHKLSKEDAALLDSVSDEDAMRRLAERLSKQAAERDRRISNHGAYVPAEGKTPPALNSDQLEQSLRKALGVS